MSENLRSRARERMKSRKMTKEDQLYEKYAGRRYEDPPQPVARMALFMFLILAGMMYYLLVSMVFYGYMYVWQFILMLGAVFAVTILGTTIAAAQRATGRTKKLKVGYAPAVIAGGFDAGENVHDITFKGTDADGNIFEDKDFFEVAWCGRFEFWPWLKGRGPAVILHCQYGVEEGRPQAGFTFGDEYIVPLEPRTMRFDWLKATRDSRFAEMLTKTPGISDKIHNSTRVIIATKPLPMPDRVEFKGPSIEDKELWHQKRITARVTGELHDVGISDRTSKAIGVKR